MVEMVRRTERQQGQLKRCKDEEIIRSNKEIWRPDTVGARGAASGNF